MRSNLPRWDQTNDNLTAQFDRVKDLDAAKRAAEADLITGRARFGLARRSQKAARTRRGSGEDTEGE